MYDIFIHFSELFSWKLTKVCSSESALPARTVRNYDLSPGPAPRTVRENTPLKIFQLFVTVSIFELIIEQSKIYATQNGKVFDLSMEELLAFIALNIVMGMVRLPRVHDYWSTKPIFRMPFFSGIMPRDRFLEISRFLHLVDSSSQKKKGEFGYDPLFKIRPLIKKTSDTFEKYYTPKQELAIDEMMIGTRCRIHFLQYIPKKPTKWGIKVFVNAESASGYVLRYCVYTGSADAAEDDTATTHGVVMSLMEKYLDKNHKLFTDNFYTSLLLCKELYERGTYLCGTVQQRRKHYPEKMKVRKNSNKNNLVRPQYRFATCGDYTVGLWHDRRDITFVSSMHSASVEVIQKRPKGGREREPIPCPSAIVEYNQHMNGVDITDQHLSYHSLTRRKTVKWWKKLFWRLIDLSILNSSIVFRQNHPESGITSNRVFRIQLVEEMIKPLLHVRASVHTSLRSSTGGRRPSDENLDRLKGKHFPYRASCRKRCVVCCSKKGSKRVDMKVSICCPKCKQHMCLGTCFEKYHTLVNYKH